MSLWQDIRYGERMLRKSPSFTATAVLTLALGIGATTAVFSVCDSLLWKPISLPNIDSLVLVAQRIPEDPKDWDTVTPADLDDVQRSSTTLASVTRWQGGLANIAGAGAEPERVSQALVGANFFKVVGVQPAIGRGFLEGEDQPGREREVILSDRLWKRRFGGDRSIIGKSILLDDQNYTVVGVMPQTFDFPMATAIWTPIALTPERRATRRSQLLVAAARLRPGATPFQASAEMENISAQLQRAYPDTNHNRRLMVLPIRRYMVDYETEQYLIMLLCSVAFVLLIACANVANLQFARATARLREIAVRTALGASRGRVITQLVTESVLLAVAGAGVGLLIARWGMNLIKGGMPPEVEQYVLGWKDISMDARALAFTLLAALLSGILAGLAPAWQCSRPNLSGTLKEGGRAGSSGGARHRLRNILVAAEVTLAVVLLAGAGLMVRGFGSLVDRAQSLEPEKLLTLRLALTDNKYPQPFQRARFYDDVVKRISALPGVRAAAVVTAMPYANHSDNRDFTIEGRPVDRDNIPHGMYQVASPSYFETLHVPLIAGRFLSASDGPDSLKVAVISQRMADRWWKNESPIGRHIRLGGPDATGPWLTIVGVVGNVLHNPYDHEPRRTIYVPFDQAPSLWMDVGVRATGDPLLLAPAVTAAIRGVDPEQPVTDVQTLERAIHNRAIGLNYMAVLMGVFGVLALVLSGIGVYGVMAYMVSEQTREIGIRMALGAAKWSVLGMIFRRGMTTIAIGLVVGMPLAWGFARLLSSMIYGVKPSDAVTFAGIPLALIVAAAVAIFVPARRAMKIDPIVALRYE